MIGERHHIKNAEANELPHAEKRAKTMNKATRPPLLAPFRVDRATAMSDIVIRAVTDDLRHSTAAAAHKMSVYAWSTFSQ